MSDTERVEASRALQRVGVLAPMPAELRPIVRRLALHRDVAHADGLHRGTAGGVDVVAALTGIGTRAAASAAERLLDAAASDHVVVVGIAGGVGPSVRIGDVVVPERVVDRANGAEHRPDRIAGLAARGALLTSDELVGREEIAALEHAGVIAVDMETAAIAAVCERRGCRWSVIRAISDRADDGSVDAGVLGLVRPDGSADLAAVVRFVLRSPVKRIALLMRLGRGMQRATDSAAQAAALALERGLAP